MYKNVALIAMLNIINYVIALIHFLKSSYYNLHLLLSGYQLAPYNPLLCILFSCTVYLHILLIHLS